MSGILENLLAAFEANTAALNAHTAALGGKSEVASAVAAKPAAAAAAKGKPAAAPKPAAPKHTIEDVQGAAVAVKEKFGSPAATELIKEFGKAEKLKEIKPENYDAFVAAATTRLEAEDEVQAEEEI